LKINLYMVQKSFKSIIEAGLVKPVPPFGALVGQYGLNTKRVCEVVNDLSFSYEEGVMLPVKVFCSSDFDEGFFIKLDSPTIGFLFSAHFYDDEYDFSFFRYVEDGVCKIPILDLYGLICVYSYFYGISLYCSTKLVLSYLGSFNNDIQINFNS